MVKSNESKKKVFYIEKGAFLRSMMEFAMKSKGAEIYTVETLDNNFYLLDDLLPDLIIFDVLTVENHLAELSKFSKRAKLVAVGEESERSLGESVASVFLPKPLVASNIASRILSLLE